MKFVLREEYRYGRSDPIEVEAAEWRQHGDHPAVSACTMREGCPFCSAPPEAHGQITVMSRHGNPTAVRVCPDDWIVTNEGQQQYRIYRPEVLHKFYQPVE